LGTASNGTLFAATFSMKPNALDVLVWSVAMLLLALVVAPEGRPPNISVSSQAALWREPHDIQTRNLFDGPGGAQRPTGRLVFLAEDTGGTKAKILVEDSAGVRWKIKLGSEARPEVVATRLVWAVGYFADENYYLSTVLVEDLPKLQRGGRYVSSDGMIHGARIERDILGDKNQDAWRWFDNPFAGTREWNGLRVMMALINNWDLKSDNNAVRVRQGVARAFYVSDLGSSFGKPSGKFPSRDDPEAYAESAFVRSVKEDAVDFSLKACPLFVKLLYPPCYLKFAKASRVVKDIPLADARWIGELLGRLSNAQLEDAFRAADYTPADVDVLRTALAGRIAQLRSL
jgi:hypothetical protein